ncbi:MAG: glucose-1-phosphate cytidylyltransferase [Acidimicrobiales bacterium]|nr:glucose-1-phosphate cytidylyltransferase [Acidimicrobiales bacterium]
MKVVLFCGGKGLRIRDHPSGAPKPMVPVGPHPILVHVMRYYARQGHNEFVLCLGDRAEVIQAHFAGHPPLPDVEHYSVTCVDTGPDAPIGTRLLRVRHLLEDEPVFLANYGDTVTDEPIERAVASAGSGYDVIASLLAARPRYTFHLVDDQSGVVTSIADVTRSDLWINGGYFVLRREVFDVLHEGEDLVGAAFDRLIARGQLHARHHHGFWAPMDTLKDNEELESLWRAGMPPWWV